MTFDQVADALTMVRMLWPHSNLGAPEETAATWHSMLGALPGEDVEAAIRELAASGREHAPPVGVVVRAAVERRQSLPEWDEALAEILAMVRRRGWTHPPGPADWSHPLIGQFMVGAWREWCTHREGDGTFLAQQRNAFVAFRVREERDARNDLIGAPRQRPRREELHRFSRAGLPVAS